MARDDNHNDQLCPASSRHNLLWSLPSACTIFHKRVNGLRINYGYEYNICASEWKFQRLSSGENKGVENKGVSDGLRKGQCQNEVFCQRNSGLMGASPQTPEIF